jgi:predicted N-acetyltransferase YhbS
MDGMKSHYENDHARCDVLANDALPPGVLVVSDVNTDEPHQRMGHATRLMQRVCRDADLGGVVLVLLPAVHSFYERFGFKQIQIDPVMMARAPITRKQKAQHG